MSRAAELFGKFEIGTAEIENVEERVSDDELKAGYFLVVGAFSRTPPKEGAAITNPMDVWHGFGEIKPDRWIVRTIKGRAHLNRLLFGQVQFHGLAFLDTTTGEIVPAIMKAGKFNVVDRKTGEPQLLAANLMISKDKGKAAGQGSAFHYTVNAARMALAKAVARCPELPLTAEGSVKELALDVDHEEEASDAAEPAGGDTSFDEGKKASRKPARSRR